MKFTAVIPVRKGSQRVQNKNFKKFAGKSLLEHKINVVQQLPVENIIINTDSEYAISLAKKLGVGYHKREEYYASSKCTNSEYHEYLAKSTDAENIIIAQVTAPLIIKKTFLECMNIFSKSNHNSLMTIQFIKEFLWFKDKPVNYKLGSAPNSQDLPEYFFPTFGIAICNKTAMIEAKNFICSKPYFYEISDIEAVDIDTETDFEFAEFLYKKHRL